MINSARYYPSLLSSISYGSLHYLTEFKQIKQSIPLIGEIKLCNIVINCQNIAVTKQQLTKDSVNSNKTSNVTNFRQRQGSLTNVIDNLSCVASSSSSTINWLSDRDLGAGVLNRFGAAMISLILHLFDNKKVTKVFGSLGTFIEELDGLSTDPSKKNRKTQIRKITSDDYCTFQLCLEPNSIMVNVTINSLAHCKYSQEILICGNDGVLMWKNSKVILRSGSNNPKIKDLARKKKIEPTLDTNNNNEENGFLFESPITEIRLYPSEPPDQNIENFLTTYRNIEQKHPELPYIFIRGLYFYLSSVKREFLDKKNFNENDPDQSGLNNKSKNPFNNLENFEHTRIVQTIVRNICASSENNRWVTVNY